MLVVDSYVDELNNCVGGADGIVAVVGSAGVGAEDVVGGGFG